MHITTRDELYENEVRVGGRDGVAKKNINIDDMIFEMKKT